MVYGPGHPLGSNGLDSEARNFLAPVADIIDGESVLERYQLVLHLRGKRRLDRGEEPWQDTALVVRVRNELVRYKSRWRGAGAVKGVWRLEGQEPSQASVH